MMARSSTAPAIGRIQKRKTNFPQIIIFGLQRAAGPYRWAKKRHSAGRRCGEARERFAHGSNLVRRHSHSDMADAGHDSSPLL